MKLLKRMHWVTYLVITITVPAGIANICYQWVLLLIN